MICSCDVNVEHFCRLQLAKFCLSRIYCWRTFCQSHCSSCTSNLDIRFQCLPMLVCKDANRSDARCVCRWFWTTAFDDMRCGLSGIRVFFFAPVPAFGWFRIVRVIVLCLQVLTVVAHLGAGSEEMSQHYVALVVFSTAWGVLGAELEIQWNHLSGAAGLDLAFVEQIIGLMIGAPTHRPGSTA